MHELSKLTGIGRARRLTTIAALGAAAMFLAGCGSHQRTPGPGTGKPPAAGTTQKVHLVWQAGGWKVSFNGGGLQNPNSAKTTLAQSTGPTMFVLDIQGAAQGVTFKDPGGLDVWEGENAKSSPQSGINSTQILGPVFTKDGKQMIFWDLNEGAAVELNYQINFTSGPSVDPIIDNGGGNWQ